MRFNYTQVWTIEASPAEVFRALTEPAALAQWFAAGSQVEPRVGGVYRFWGRHTVGTPSEDSARQTITRFEPDAVLGFEWPINEVATDVLIRLDFVSEGTMLSLSHDVPGDLHLPRQRELIENHWRIAMKNLDAYLHGGQVMKPDYFDPSS